MTLYVIPDVELPASLPDHDVAIVIASDSEDCRDALRKIERAAARWPRPLLNPPQLVCNLDRDKLHRLLDGIDGLEIPATIGVSRAQLLAMSCVGARAAQTSPTDLAFPMIVRPRGSHAGAGLAKIDDRRALARYLDERQEQEFFVSRFVDYSSARRPVSQIPDRLHRWPALCLPSGDRRSLGHLVSQRRHVGQREQASRRSRSSCARSTSDFAQRHARALAGIAERIGLDYFTVDCAETKDGSLLIFEADNTAIVHDMDPPDIFPYKPPQMRKVFDAFAAMLDRRAAQQQERAA